VASPAERPPIRYSVPRSPAYYAARITFVQTAEAAWARLEWFLPEEGFSALSLALSPDQDAPTAGGEPAANVQPESHDPEE
jgi:hypothetical protein